MADHIERQSGLAAMKPYKPGKPIEEVKREYGLDDVIKLASNENPLGPSPRALAAMEQTFPSLNLYPDSLSYNLRQAVAEHLGFELEQIAVGNGADGLIMQLSMAYLDEGSEVIVSQSSFPVYDKFAHVMRAKLVKTPLKDYGLDLDAMAQAVTDKTRLIFVCNPNNPTGTIVSADEVKDFMEQMPAHVLVVFDEAYYELVESDASYPDTLAYIREGRQNVVTMRTFSKVYGLAGIRLGYAVAAPKILEPMFQAKSVFAVNRMAQVAGIAALQDDEFLRKSVEANRAGRNFLYGELDRLGLSYVESHTNFILVEIGLQAAEVQQGLLEKGVIVRPCVNYGLPNFIRVSVGSQPENARLIETLKAVL